MNFWVKRKKTEITETGDGSRCKSKIAYPHQGYHLASFHYFQLNCRVAFAHQLTSSLFAFFSRSNNPRMEEAQERHMDHELYMAAQMRGATIPTGVNYHSQTLVGGNNAFHVAAMYGNHEFITRALTVEALVNDEENTGPDYHLLVCQKNSNGETPLHLAAQFGHYMIVEALVSIHHEEWEPCWSQIDVNGDTPLHKALRNGHEDIAKLLIDKDGRLISANNTAGERLAYLAAENLCNRFLNHILESRPIHQNFVSFSAPRGQTVFHSARRLTGKPLSLK